MPNRKAQIQLCPRQAEASGIADLPNGIGGIYASYQEWVAICTSCLASAATNNKRTIILAEPSVVSGLKGIGAVEAGLRNGAVVIRTINTNSLHGQIDTDQIVTFFETLIAESNDINCQVILNTSHIADGCHLKRLVSDICTITQQSKLDLVCLYSYENLDAQTLLDELLRWPTVWIGTGKAMNPFLYQQDLVLLEESRFVSLADVSTERPGDHPHKDITTNAPWETVNHISQLIRQSLLQLVSLTSQIPPNENADDIEKAIRHASEATLQLLDDASLFAQLQHAGADAEFNDCDLPEMIASLVSFTNTTFSGCGKTVRYDLNGQIPTPFRTDPKQLRQLLLGLFNIALQISPTQNEIRLVVDTDTDKNMIAFRIDVFTAFADENSGKRSSESAEPLPFHSQSATGMELSVCQSIAKLLGGSISIACNYQYHKILLTLPIETDQDTTQPMDGMNATLACI